jgi:iron complex outermembrane receptor protein
VAWSPDDERTAWASVSRAVRTPTPIDERLSLTVLIDPAGPTFARVLGNPAFRSEKVLALQTGYRLRPYPWLSLDATAFYHRYRDLLSLEMGTPFAEPAGSPARIVVPFTEENRLRGKGWGGEIAVEAQVRQSFRLSGHLSELRLDLETEPGSTDTTQKGQEGSSPRHQFLLRGSWNPRSTLELDVFFRHVGELPTQRIDAYQALDARVGWWASDMTQLSLTATNLLDDHHPEFGTDPRLRTEIERAFLGELRLTW